MQTHSVSSLPIVLTGTIIPSVSSTSAKIDILRRRNEYLAAIDYYAARSTKVYFLENSQYDLDGDASFSRHPNVQTRKMRVSDRPERGKGYQEFQMLDSWITANTHPPVRWIKITGRYIVSNISRILSDCEEDKNHALIIDQVPYRESARTYLFCATTDFYLKTILGLYKKCDDPSGQWIERIFYKALAHEGTAPRFFPTKPNLQATIGDSGIAYPQNRLSNMLKQGLRKMNELVDQRYLWFSR